MGAIVIMKKLLFFVLSCVILFSGLQANPIELIRVKVQELYSLIRAGDSDGLQNFCCCGTGDYRGLQKFYCYGDTKFYHDWDHELESIYKNWRALASEESESPICVAFDLLLEASDTKNFPDEKEHKARIATFKKLIKFSDVHLRESVFHRKIDSWLPCRSRTINVRGHFIHIAASRGNCEVLRILLDSYSYKYPWYINSEDDYGWTPLEHAAAAGFEGAVTVLLDRGAKIGSALLRSANKKIRRAIRNSQAYRNEGRDECGCCSGCCSYFICADNCLTKGFSRRPGEVDEA